MGHCEMLLAVAGLDQNAIQERTRRLASGDWSHFTPAERAAFAFARKQAKEPWSVSAANLRELEKHFGRARALDVHWWSCRCHYMTRVADAFQLPLVRGGAALLAAGPVLIGGGAIAGGFAGAMSTVGYDDETGKNYVQNVQQGKILVTAEAHGPDSAARL